jgi:hypothetical protein
METFKQTSDDPYDRHDYKLVFSDCKTLVFDNYEDLQLVWFQSPWQFLSHVEVLDKKKKKTKSKGFL